MARNLHHMSWSWCLLTFPTPLIRVPDWESTNEDFNLRFGLRICILDQCFSSTDRAAAANHTGESEYPGYPGWGRRSKQSWNSCAADHDCACNHGRSIRGRKFQHCADAACSRRNWRSERHDRLRFAKPDSERLEQGADPYG